MEIKKAHGVIRSWYATVEGESLPCVHEHWWIKGDMLRRYHDIPLRPSAHNDEFVAQIRKSKKVILTGSKPFSPLNPLPLERAGYIAIWTVEDVEFDENGLRFKFADKVCNLK